MLATRSQLASRPSASRSQAFAPARACRVGRVSLAVRVYASAPVNPTRAAISSVVSSIYKASAIFAQADSSASPLWQALQKLDVAGVQAAIRSGANLNERDANGDTPLLMIARAGHYKYPPAEIPAALIKGGADKEATDKAGMTALQVSLLAGWQNIAYLLVDSGASTAGVASIKGRLTCPDCKRLVEEYKL